MKTIVTIMVLAFLAPATGLAGTVAPGGSWNAAYQAADPGESIVVAAGDYPDQVIQPRADLRNGTCSPADESRCVTFTMEGPVKINGNLEVRGSGIMVDGGGILDVAGYADSEATSVATSPDHVVFKRGHSSSFGVFSSSDVVFQDWDVGPNTVSIGCQALENKVGHGGGVAVQPRNVLFNRVRVHDQNGDIGRVFSNCHFGGLFVVTVDGLTIQDSVFERNVVYHIQLQNFSGPPPTNVLIENSSFSCPVDWLYRTPLNCDGQRAIQLNTSSPGVTMKLVGNLSANGGEGLFGCYTPCDRSGVTETGTVNLPQSLIAPLLANVPGWPFPGGSGLPLPPGHH